MVAKFKCHGCEYHSGNPNSVARHLRYCTGPLVRKGKPCPKCPFSSETENGLKVHISTVHPEEWNKALPTKRRNFRWDDAGYRFVASKVLEFKRKNVRGVNEAIAALLPDRSAEAIRKIRSKAEFKAILRELSELDQSNEGGDENPETVRDRPFVDVDDGRFREEARRATRDFVRTGARDEQVDSAVDSYLVGESSWEDLSKVISALGVAKAKPKRGTRANPRRAGWRDRDNARNRARLKYKQLQRAWERDKKATMRQVVDDNFRYDEDQTVLPPLDQVETVYSERLESPIGIEQVPRTEEPVRGEHVYGAFRVEEMASAIKSTKKETAMGIDGISNDAIKALGCENATAIMNRWWADGVPEVAQLCRTTLIPKGVEGRDNVNNWRPITIGNLLVRLFAKMWDRRLRQLVKVDSRQQGFVPVDGCFNNVKLLQHVIKKRRRSRREINVVFLDLAKAFDTVPHDSIWNALRRHRVPEEVIGGIRQLYSKASTTVRVGEERTRPINILRGVKQGCPLSPLLFNLVMDELLDEMRNLNVGVRVGDERVSIMAFADDLVIITESGDHCSRALSTCSEFFRRNGLEVNARKCASLRVLPTKGRAMKVVEESHRTWNGVPIPSIDWEHLYKYLGIKVLPTGNVLITVDEFGRMLENVKRSKLKAMQKFECITSVIVPRILYQLRLADAPMGILRRLNTLVRNEVKKILRLPPWTATDWLHAKGGLGLMDLMVVSLRAKHKAVNRMEGLPAGAVSGTMEVAHELRPRISGQLNSVNLLEGCRLVNRDELERRRRRNILQHRNGKCVEAMMSTTVRRHPWLTTHGQMRDRVKLTILKGLSGTLPHRVNQSRGLVDRNEKLCRRCGKTAETDIHLLAECNFTKGLRSKRHDRVVDTLGGLIRDKNHGWETQVERSWRVGQRVFRPDLTVKNGNDIYLVEVTVPFEQGYEYLVQRSLDKTAKYEPLRRELVRSGLYGNVEVIPVVIGSWGTLLSGCRDSLKKLRVDSGASLLASVACSGSVSIVRTHLNSSDF